MTFVWQEHLPLAAAIKRQDFNNDSKTHSLNLNYQTLKNQAIDSCGLYYKPMTIINDDSGVINKLEASFTDDARVVIYNRHMFIVQATAYT